MPAGSSRAARLEPAITPAMNQKEPHPRSHLFTLRVWPEALGEGRAEWRGKVQHVTSGETRYFRDWPSLVVYLEEILAGLEDEAESSQ
jgi:hypothetical protein